METRTARIRQARLVLCLPLRPNVWLWTPPTHTHAVPPPRPLNISGAPPPDQDFRSCSHLPISGNRTSVLPVTQPTQPHLHPGITLTTTPLPPHLHPTRKSCQCSLEMCQESATSARLCGYHPGPGPSHVAPGPFAWPRGPPDLCLPPSLCPQQGGRSSLLKHKSDCLCIRLEAPISTGPLVGSPCCTPALGPPQVPSPLLECQVPTRSAPSPPHASLTSDLKTHDPSQHSPACPCCFSSKALSPATPSTLDATFLLPLECRTQTFCVQVYLLPILMCSNILS